MPPNIEIESEKDDQKRGVPPQLTGFIERLIFTSLVVIKPDAGLIAIGGWMGMKMAANWNKNPWSDDPSREAVYKRLVWNRHAFLGLLTGLVSMSLAGAGGLLGRAIMCVGELRL